MKQFFTTVLLLSVSSVLSRSSNKRIDEMYFALICQEDCEVQVRLSEHRTPQENFMDPPFNFTLKSMNATIQETNIEVPEDVNFIEMLFSCPDENGTTSSESDVWNLNAQETYFHFFESLQVVGNLPCGKYGCAQIPLCDGGCRFTVIASLAAFCLSVLAGLLLQTVYVSFLGFRKARKELELRDKLRLTEPESTN